MHSYRGSIGNGRIPGRRCILSVVRSHLQATYDRNQQILVEAVQAVPSPDDPAVAPSALMFDRGDKIELISSTRTCAPGVHLTHVYMA